MSPDSDGGIVTVSPLRWWRYISVLTQVVEIYEWPDSDGAIMWVSWVQWRECVSWLRCYVSMVVLIQYWIVRLECPNTGGGYIWVSCLRYWKCLSVTIQLRQLCGCPDSNSMSVLNQMCFFLNVTLNQSLSYYICLFLFFLFFLWKPHFESRALIYVTLVGKVWKRWKMVNDYRKQHSLWRRLKNISSQTSQ